MNENFANFTPPNIPSAPSQPGNGPQMNNSGPTTGFESQSQWSRSIAKSGKIKAATTAIIQTRQDFKDYLRANGMDLFTSAIEFRQTGDFITSSYILYVNYQNYMEPLAQFLQRYPQLQAPVMQIRDRLKPMQANMDVISRNQNQSGNNQYSQFNGL